MSSLSEAEAQDLAIKHYEGLRRYLASYLTSRQAAANSSQQREAARTKLTKLSRIQFADMATDVYDEMNRRYANCIACSMESFSFRCMHLIRIPSILLLELQIQHQCHFWPFAQNFIRNGIKHGKSWVNVH